MVYLIQDKKRDCSLFKVGYTDKPIGRKAGYKSHNGQFILIDTVATYRKTKHHLETAIHNEIKAKGYEYTRKEWFIVPIDQEDEFAQLGLTQFKACKKRKVHKHNTII